MLEDSLKNSQGKLTPEERAFGELMEASKQKNYKVAIKRVLMDHRGKPYFEDLFEEAETLLKLKKHSLIQMPDYHQNKNYN